MQTRSAAGRREGSTAAPSYILPVSEGKSLADFLGHELYGQMNPMQGAIPQTRRSVPLSCLIFDRINGPAANAARERNVDTNELYARGLRRRQKMFGEADV